MNPIATTPTFEQAAAERNASTSSKVAVLIRPAIVTDRVTIR